jgi:hypothetical protein
MGDTVIFILGQLIAVALGLIIVATYAWLL